MKEAIKITAVIIGTIIGAGFISGQEIYSFFNKYGEYGKIGILISIFLIVFIIYKTLKIIHNNKIKNYEEFLNIIIPGKNKFLNSMIKNIINIFLIISFFIMCSAFSTYCYENYQIPKILGGIIINILLYIVLIKDVKLIIKINEILMPLIIIFIIIMYFINKSEIINNIEYNNNVILSAIFYANYNTILLLPMLVALKKQLITKKQIKLVAILSFIILFIITFFIYKMQTGIEIGKFEMPMVEISRNISNEIWLVYGIMTIIAIFTSAISAGYSILSNINDKNKIKKVAKILCIISIPISLLSFSSLVNLLYPIFGILSTIQIIFILKT